MALQMGRLQEDGDGLHLAYGSLKRQRTYEYKLRAKGIVTKELEVPSVDTETVAGDTELTVPDADLDTAIGATEVTDPDVALGVLVRSTRLATVPEGDDETVPLQGGVWADSTLFPTSHANFVHGWSETWEEFSNRTGQKSYIEEVNNKPDETPTEIQIPKSSRKN